MSSQLFIHRTPHDYIIRYGGKDIKVFDDSAIIIENGHAILSLQMDNQTIGHIGMCHQCKHNWYSNQDQLKHGCLCCPDRITNIEVNICNVCKYLANIIINLDGHLLTSLHMCQCSHNASSLNDKYSLNEEAIIFLKNISLS